MSVEKSGTIPVTWLGTVSYQNGYEQQEFFHAQVVAETLPGCILTLEHTPVLTLGKHADPSLVFISEAERHTQGIDLVQTDRGGEVTAHMPGQLVVYPILPLVALRIQPRAYVNILVRAVIDTLAVWGIESRCDADHPGVWVGMNKICAIGVRIRERVSMHGIALNANNSLHLFERIVPCGIRDRGVTSMALELDRVIDMDALRNELVRRLQLGLGFGHDVQADSARRVGAPQACQV